VTTPYEDRRGQPRAELTGTAVAFLGDQLLTPVMREPGQFLRVNFSLAPPGGIPRWYDADGIVVRVDRTAKGVVLGVQFVVIDDRVARSVHDYVAETWRRRTASATPNATQPPPMTGEFFPASERRTGEQPVITEAPRRRTAEYGINDVDAASRSMATSSRVPTQIPTTHAPHLTGTGVGAGGGSTTRTPTQPPTASSRRPTPTPTPRTTAPAATPPTPDPEVAARFDLERLFKDALSEVDGKRAGARRDRRK
jgi:hypothetical protein